MFTANVMGLHRQKTTFTTVFGLLIIALASPLRYAFFKLDGVGEDDRALLRLAGDKRRTTVDPAYGLGVPTVLPDWNRANPLEIPKGQAPNLPSIRLEDNSPEAFNSRRKTLGYGGAGDKQHLGGFTDLDLQGISPTVWKNLVAEYNVKSVLDVGCGRGISTSWFLDHSLDVLCVEGSHDAVQQTMLDDPEKNIVEHDFSRGPWWPAKTYDAAWAVEFLEHVGMNFHFNYVTTFRKAALIFVSSSVHGGWHHVEVHRDDWWIMKYEAYGLRYSEALTKEVRGWAKSEQHKTIPAFGGKNFNAQHIWLTMKVFVNPVVAALPEHAHLFYKPGCVVGPGKPNRKCGEGSATAHMESKLPDSFLPINLTEAMDNRWTERVKRNTKVSGGDCM